MHKRYESWGTEMREARTAHRQRALMASDSEWERITKAASEAGMEKSRYVIQRALAPESLPPEVMLRVIRQGLVLAVVEEREIRDAGAGDRWDAACAAVDSWFKGEGAFAHLTDPGAANRWKVMSRPDMGENEPS